MAEGYGQHGGWDLHPAYVPYPASLDTPAPVEYGMSYQSTPTDLRIWVCSPSHVHGQVAVTCVESWS